MAVMYENIVNRVEWLGSPLNIKGANKVAMSGVTNRFLLVRSSVGSKQLLCFLHGQGQKSEQKPTAKNFVGFHNHSPPLTMMTNKLRVIDFRSIFF